MQRFGFATTALEATLEVLTERYQALLLADHLAAVRSAIESDSLAQVSMHPAGPWAGDGGGGPL